MINKLTNLTDIGQAICLFLATIGAIVAKFLGGWDMPLQALLIIIIIDYITGLICAIVDKKVDSSVGFKGIAKKVFIFLLVGLAVLIDKITGMEFLRNLVIVFYFCNEGISILENTSKLGMPYPEKLKEILEQLKEEKTSKNTEK